MTKGPTRNLAASVQQRLLNLARERNEEYNLLLQRYVMERLLYRLSRSAHEKDFVLKGAVLFSIWSQEPHRATRDIDLCGKGSPDLDRLKAVFLVIIGTQVEDDGLTFLSESIQVSRIREDAEYEGVRVDLEARLGNARIKQQVDVGFGDAITPRPVKTDLPTLLAMPYPRLWTYPRETVIAEKCQAMVMLGMANSRMKDFYDVHCLAQTFDFDGGVLGKALKATFRRRKTDIPTTEPIALTPTFSTDTSKQAQWHAFLRKTRASRSDLALPAVVEALHGFLWLPLQAQTLDRPFSGHWQVGGPWIA